MSGQPTAPPSKPAIASHSVVAVRQGAVFAALWPCVSVGLRLYRGMQYVSDAIFGMLLGFVCVALGIKIIAIGKADRNKRQASATAPNRLTGEAQSD